MPSHDLSFYATPYGSCVVAGFRWKQADDHAASKVSSAYGRFA
jgi:hypothetical protein